MTASTPPARSDPANVPEGPPDLPPASVADAVRRRRTIVTLGIGYAMVILDRTIVNVALPTIGRDLHAGVAALQWVVDGYVLVMASLLLSGGALGDWIGAARAFRVAVVLFTAASIACALAPTAPVLVGARLIQGVGAALLMPASWALMAEAYPDAGQRVRALAMWGAIGGSPQALGPTLGGLLVTATGWRAIFLINIPLGVLVLLLARRGLPVPAPVREDRRRGLDLPGQLTAMIMLASLTLALIDGGASGWAQPVPLIAGVTALAGALALVQRERHTTHPMLPPRLLRAKGLASFAAIGVLLFFSYYGFVFALSLSLGQTSGGSALQIGLVLLPAALPIVAVPPLATRLVTRIGPRPVVAVGAFIATVGCIALAAVATHAGPWLFGATLFVIGVGSGMAFLPQASLVVAAAPAGFGGVTSGLMNATRQCGSMIGVAVLGAIAVGGSGSVGGTGGLSLAAFTAAAVMVLAAVIAVSAGRFSRDREAR